MHSIRTAQWAIFTLLACLASSMGAFADEGVHLSKWTLQPAEWKGAIVDGARAIMTAEKWSYLVQPEERTDASLSATITIDEPAKQFGFFGQSWSAWPDKTFGDSGFEAALLLRSGTTSTPFEGKTIVESFGYRVQLSHKYQVLALVKFPEGGYVRVVPYEVKLKTPHKLQAVVEGNQVLVRVDGQEKIRWHDAFLPLEKGQFGIGVSSSAKVTLNDVSMTAAESLPSPLPDGPHVPRLSVRKFLGDRLWVFDGDEPILQLHNVRDPSCFAKLKPGYKPQLTFDSHWGLENQGAFPDAASKWTEPVTNGSGDTVQATWSARNVKDRFVTGSTLTVRFDDRRGMYTYDIESELEVLPGEPFHFRYGFDFEHHTPLDPFRWQYLIARRKNGQLYHRPVYPIDPGPQNDLETYHGLRVWYGRHVDQQYVAPAIEYGIQADWNRDAKDPSTVRQRKLNTAVCAAFYDTGVSFEPETAPPGTKIRVQYRYTGYPVEEAKHLFEQSHIYDAPTLDPTHHYIFADQWPKLTFSKFVPLSETWIAGRTPFMTAHNTRPTYELQQNCGAGSGFAMKLGPASFGKANLPVKDSLTQGRWIVTALVKSDNAHGPGGRIELEAKEAKTNKVLATAQHYVGNGTFDWQRQGFAFEVPANAGSLSIAFGNGGTGAMLVTDVEFRKLKDGEGSPAGVLSQANNQPSKFPAAPAGAIADYRMEEGRGNYVFNYAGGNHLELANLDWVVDASKPALRFAENASGRKDYPLAGTLNRNYFSHPSYAGKETLPVALAGNHGGGVPLTGLSLAAWIKPAAEMGLGGHRGKGDIIGYGARRFILSLHGQTAPYKLAARINVNDAIVSDTKLEADHWYHVAMTAEPADGQWRVRLFIDGKSVADGLTQKFAPGGVVPPSLILGAEIFYMHDAYYRGLIGHTLVFDRTLSPAEIADLAR